MGFLLHVAFTKPDLISAEYVLTQNGSVMSRENQLGPSCVYCRIVELIQQERDQRRMKAIVQFIDHNHVSIF